MSIDAEVKECCWPLVTDQVDSACTNLTFFPHLSLGKWSFGEINRLLRAIKDQVMAGNNGTSLDIDIDWEAVTDAVVTRSRQQCQDIWFSRLKGVCQHDGFRPTFSTSDTQQLLLA